SVVLRGAHQSTFSRHNTSSTTTFLMVTGGTLLARQSLPRTGRQHLASNGSFLLAAASAACSKSVISRSVRQSKDFTTSSAPTMVRLGRCVCLCHSCSPTVEWTYRTCRERREGSDATRLNRTFVHLQQVS